MTTNLSRLHFAGKDISNRILSGLGPQILGELAPFMEPVALRRDQILHQPGERIRRVHFIQNGMAVFTKMMRDGRGTMIASAGTEGMTVPNVANGMVRTDIGCSVPVDGSSLALDAEVLERLAEALPALRSALRRYDLFMDEQIAQLSGCNRLHTLEQRCARLLLTAQDNAGARAFSLTQETIAAMLGAQRPHVSAVAANFQSLGLIHYRHGQIRVTDPCGLKAMSCECYEFIRDHAQAMFDLPANGPD